MAGLVEKFNEMWSPSEEEYDEQDSMENRDNDKRNRVVNFKSGGKSKVILAKPERFSEEIKEIADELLSTNTIVLNLEEVVKAEARRIIDFLSGVAYANGGAVKKVATDTFVITPCNVDFEGNDLFNGLDSQEAYF